MSNNNNSNNSESFYKKEYHLLSSSVERLQSENRKLYSQLNELKSLLATKIKDAELMTVKGCISLLLVKLELLETQTTNINSNGKKETKTSK